MTSEEIQARAEQLSAQIKPNGGHAHHPAFNGTSEINKLVADLTSRVDLVATAGNPAAEALAADVRSQLDTARPKHANQLDYPAIFTAIAEAESAVDELEALVAI